MQKPIFQFEKGQKIIIDRDNIAEVVDIVIDEYPDGLKLPIVVTRYYNNYKGYYQYDASREIELSMTVWLWSQNSEEYSQEYKGIIKKYKVKKVWDYQDGKYIEIEEDKWDKRFKNWSKYIK